MVFRVPLATFGACNCGRDSCASVTRHCSSCVGCLEARLGFLSRHPTAADEQEPLQQWCRAPRNRHHNRHHATLQLRRGTGWRAARICIVGQPWALRRRVERMWMCADCVQKFIMRCKKSRTGIRTLHGIHHRYSPHRLVQPLNPLGSSGSAWCHGLRSNNSE